MNYIKHLTGFFEKVAIDKTLNPTHVSLYVALFQFWNCNRFKNPISISRDEVMRISKISSKGTYHKCLKNLHALGYINYEPSYNPFKGSIVYLLNFSDNLKPITKIDKKATSKNEQLIEQVNGLVVDKLCTSTGTGSRTGSEQALVSYINNTNITNNKNIKNSLNLDEQEKKIEDDDVIARNEAILENETAQEEKKLREKKNEFLVTSIVSSRAQSKDEKPTIENVKAYFHQQNFPEIEADKFFNYFSSVGWLVGGKTPMVNWQAAAQNWLLNAPKFTAPHNVSNRAKKLYTDTEKDYSEPL